MPRPPAVGDAATDDRFGFDETSDWLRESAGRLLPQPVARRAVSVAVDIDRETLAVGEVVEVTVEFRNRLPVPVALATPTRRRWGWTVDGELAASDERAYGRPAPGSFVFRGGERKRVVRRWDGRIRRTDGTGTRWVAVEPGEHEIAAFVATATRRPRARRTVRVRER